MMNFWLHFRDTFVTRAPKRASGPVTAPLLPNVSMTAPYFPMLTHVDMGLPTPSSKTNVSPGGRRA